MNDTEIAGSEKLSTKPEDLGWASLGKVAYARLTLIAFLLWYLFRHETASLVQKWNEDPSWSHGYLIPFFSLYLVHQNRDKILRLKSGANYLGLLALLFCILIYPINIVHFKFAYGQPLIMIAAIGSIVLFLGGWKLVRYTWLPIAYLLFAVPLPGRFYTGITIEMRKLAAQAATFVLNLVPELKASAQGVVIDVTYKGVVMEPALDVAEACSGMRLLMAFLALGVAMAYLHYRPAWQRVVLLASTIPIAILCNVIRVTVTGFIYILWDPQYAQGTWHDMLGISMLFVAFGLYGIEAWFMSNLFIDEDVSEDIVVSKITSGTSD